METWAPRLPELSTCLWLGPLLGVLVGAGGYLCGWLRVRRGLRANDTRKLFHFIVFSLAAVLALGLGMAAVNLLGGIAGLYVAWLLTRGEGDMLYEGLAREEDRPRRSLHILVPYLATAAGGALAAYFFGPVAVVGYLVGGWADAIAEPVGVRFGKHRYRVPALGGGVVSQRSLEGSAAVLVASFAAALVALEQLPPPLESSFLRLVSIALAVAAVSTLVEGASPHGLDNLTLQLAASATAYCLWGA